ncbi:hypothetical protein S2E19_03736 [Bacillus mycoides]|nr:hypothetical protein S2E19_03736 [Bacillus mycoides]OSY15377.1 hypothetical protein BTJ48_03797 [Bacillus mycoides]
MLFVSDIRFIQILIYCIEVHTCIKVEGAEIPLMRKAKVQAKGERIACNIY